ncbi:MAG TPA: nickel-dependent hydrogenase large subunit [Streptosporangiaceae bacterium]|nr:nickel-dependent hydrogenase large subunit [Streptosporangiaceae bacterium]
MTHRGERTLVTTGLARVEGEGSMYVRVAGDQVEQVRLDIYEPPRFFEAFLRGRSYIEPPDITARICGICPVAYQTSACQAIEAACGVRLTDELADLRRLLYCGEWISSHALHIYMLHAPDFLGYPGAVEMARDHREVVERGLALRRTANVVMATIGGRSVHPVNVRVGGFYRAPSAGELRPLAEQLRAALDLAVETVRWVSGFEFADFRVEHEFLALTEPGRYPIERGTLISSGGLAFDGAEFEQYVTEEQVPHSTALHARLAAPGQDGAGGSGGDGRYLTGPLARYSLNSRWLTPAAAESARAAGLGPVCRNPFQSIIVRAVEVVCAIEEALALIERYRQPAEPFVPVTPRAGLGHGISEAPRGVLYHRYELDSAGNVAAAKIVPPTSQNQGAITDDLREFVADRLDFDDLALTRACEQAIRNYDPCISCAAHFLTLTVDRQ